MPKAMLLVVALSVMTALSLVALVFATFYYAPMAQMAAGGFAQKIFYFHVPSAYAMFGLVVLTSGPLWAKKAWGVYWTWDPRLTTLLLSVLIYAAIVMLRAFAGDGEAERKFAAALGVLGTVTLPIVHLSVRKWGGNHPTVITKGGGGIAPSMAHVLLLGFVAMTLLAILLLWVRARGAWLESREADLQEQFMDHADDEQ